MFDNISFRITSYRNVISQFFQKKKKEKKIIIINHRLETLPKLRKSI